MLIPAKPFFIKTNKDRLISDINSIQLPLTDLSYSENGKSALISSLINLGIEKESVIACPAFICKDVPESILNVGYEVRYFDINEKLEILNQDLISIIKDDTIKAIILVDYFGFNNINNLEIIKKLKVANKIIILDRCHSAISGNYSLIFDYVDAIAVSFKKFLNVRDGGAIIIKNSSFEKIRLGKGLKFGDFIFEFRSFVEKFFSLLGIINIYSNNLYKIKDKIRKSQNKFQYKKIKYYNNSKLFNILNNDHLLGEVKSKRQLNYKKLVNLIHEKKILLNLDDESLEFVPQVLPIIDHKGGLLEHLRNKGIATYTWPGNDMPDYIIENKIFFKYAVELNRSIVCVPIHHSLNRENIIYISESINSFYK